MNKLKMVLVVLLVFFMPLLGNTGKYSDVTDELDAGTTVVTANPCVFGGVVVKTNGSADATVTVYDNTSAAGKIVMSFVVIGSEQVGGVVNLDLTMSTGLTVVLAGTGSHAYVVWKNAFQNPSTGRYEVE